MPPAEAETSVALNAAGLTKTYAQRPVINALDLTLPRGQLVGLLGSNGAGKTTLFKMLAGLIRPDEGSISIGGYDMRTHESAVRERLAYTPDVPHFYAELTVLEHLELQARAHCVLSGFASEAELLLRHFGLWEARQMPPFTLSRGMQQKLALCMAFIRPSRVMLLDEPGSTLDIQSLEALYEVLGWYRRAGGLALLTSHQWQPLQANCDSFVLLDHGRVAAEGDLPSLRHTAGLPEAATLADVYFAILGVSGAYVASSAAEDEA